MSILERRLQILIDAEMAARLDEEAKRDGRSVGSIIREAIDFRWRHEADLIADRRAAAAGELLALAEMYPDPEPFDIAEFNEAWEREKSLAYLYDREPAPVSA